VINPATPPTGAPAWDCGLPVPWCRFSGKLASGWSFVSDKPTKSPVVGLGMMPAARWELIFLAWAPACGLLTTVAGCGRAAEVIATTFLAPVLLRLVLSAQEPTLPINLLRPFKLGP